MAGPLDEENPGGEGSSGQTPLSPADAAQLMILCKRALALHDEGEPLSLADKGKGRDALRDSDESALRALTAGFSFTSPMVPPVPRHAPLESAAPGKPPSLLFLFPEVEQALLLAVIDHQLAAKDLYKLDSQFRDKSDGPGDSTNEATTREYKTLNSLLVPLFKYFQILAAHTGQIEHVLKFFTYSEHLLRFHADYEWPAILAYHSAYFNKRRRDMSQQNFRSWGSNDTDLFFEHLIARRRVPKAAVGSAGSKKASAGAAKTVCNNFNLGKCASPCQFNRQHVCSTCASTAHAANACKGKGTSSA